MFSDRAERAAAKAAAHDIDRKADHLIGRNTGIAVSRVRHSLIRQRKHAIHLFSGERYGGRVDPDIAVAVFLHQRPRAARVSFVMQNTRRMGVQHLVAFHLFKGWQQDIGFFPRLRTRRLHGNRLGFLLFRRDGFVVGARQVFAIGMGNWIDFTRRVQTSGVDAAPARQSFFNHNRSVTHVANLIDGFAHCQTVRHFHQRTLTVAKHQHVGFGID